MNSQERYSRQTSLVPMQKLEESDIEVIGIGAIGRNVAVQLASIGAKKIKLIDFDIVEESNIASQGYKESDIGKYKVDATAEICREINKDIIIESNNRKFKKGTDKADIVFSCVDSISIRKFIWQNIKDTASLFIDGRMAAETLRVISLNNRNMDYYTKTLFEENEAFAEACTAKTTIYTANIAAGFLVGAYTKFLRNMMSDPDIVINLTGNEIIRLC